MNDEVQLVSTEWFSRDVRRLPANLRARVDRRIRGLGKKGWTASAHSRDVAELGDGIWELRVVGQGPAFRVLFFLDPRYPGRRVVLMACVAKASMKKAHVMENLRDPEYAALWAESLPRIDLAVNVCLLRMERGLSQKQLAEAAGLSQPRITEIERSDANPTLLTITRIANALGVRVERLFADKAVSDAESAALPQAKVVEREQATVPRPVRKRKPRALAALAS